MFLSYIHNFRAAAIIFVVLGNATYGPQWSDSIAGNFIKDLFQNGTVLFVFIAGYLFEYLAGNYSYGKYLAKKIKFIICPYLVVSVPAVVHAVYIKDPASVYEQLEGANILYQIFWYYIKGGAHINDALWFIPMIAIYFLLAPLFYALIERPKLYYVLIVLIPLSAFAHRPFKLDTVGLAFYYLPAYICGMWASTNREMINRLLDKRLYLIGFIFLSFFLIHLIFAKHHGNYTVPHLFSQKYGYVDWTFLQKLFLCFFLLGLLKAQDALLKNRLSFIADASFTIYFIHVYWIVVFQYFIPSSSTAHGVIYWLGSSLFAFTLSAASAYVGQKVLGRSSRMIIGI